MWRNLRIFFVAVHGRDLLFAHKTLKLEASVKPLISKFRNINLAQQKRGAQTHRQRKDVRLIHNFSPSDFKPPKTRRINQFGWSAVAFMTGRATFNSSMDLHRTPDPGFEG